MDGYDTDEALSQYLNIVESQETPDSFSDIALSQAYDLIMPIDDGKVMEELAAGEIILFSCALLCNFKI